jgi:hypothetical protein
MKGTVMVWFGGAWIGVTDVPLQRYTLRAYGKDVPFTPRISDSPKSHRLTTPMLARLGATWVHVGVDVRSGRRSEQASSPDTVVVAYTSWVEVMVIVPEMDKVTHGPAAVVGVGANA